MNSSGKLAPFNVKSEGAIIIDNTLAASSVSLSSVWGIGLYENAKLIGSLDDPGAEQPRFTATGTGVSSTLSIRSDVRVDSISGITDNFNIGDGTTVTLTGTANMPKGQLNFGSGSKLVLKGRNAKLNVGKIDYTNLTGTISVSNENAGAITVNEYIVNKEDIYKEYLTLEYSGEPGTFVDTRIITLAGTADKTVDLNDYIHLDPKTFGEGSVINDGRGQGTVRTLKGTLSGAKDAKLNGKYYTWADIVSAIDKAADPNADYVIEINGRVDAGAVKLPKEQNYRSLTITGDEGDELRFQTAVLNSSKLRIVNITLRSSTGRTVTVNAKGTTLENVDIDNTVRLTGNPKVV